MAEDERPADEPPPSPTEPPPPPGGWQQPGPEWQQAQQQLGWGQQHPGWGQAPPPGWGQAQPGWGPQPYGPAPSTNGLAIASMILGILWICTIGSILALVFGYAAKRQIGESHGQQSGDGFATAGIVLGWVGVGFALLYVVWIVVAVFLGTVL